MRKILILNIFILKNIFLFAQAYTLSDCIDYAYNHRIELQCQQIASEYYNKNYKNSIYGILPSVQWNTNYKFSSDSQSQKMHTSSVSLNSELTLFDGFRTVNEIKRSKLLKVRNQTETEKIRNNIRLEVIDIFYGLLLDKENVRIYGNSIVYAKQQISLMSQAVSAGRISNVDLIEMRAQLEKYNNNYATAIKQYEQDFIKLKKAINYKEQEPLMINDMKDTLIYSLPSIKELFAVAVLSLPEFQLARQDSLLALYDLRLAKSQYSPILSLRTELSTNYQRNFFCDFTNQLKNHLFKIAEISFSIPFYSKRRFKIQQNEKERQFFSLLLNNAQLYQDVFFEIEFMYHEFVQNQECVKSGKIRKDYFMQIYEMRYEQYKQGTLSITDLLVAESNLRNAEIELAYFIYKLQYNYKLIQYYCGII